MLLRLQTLLTQMSPADARIADAILLDPGQVIVQGVSGLAEAYGVAQPTLSRFAKRMGYAGFPELRLAIARDLAVGSGAPSAPDASEGTARPAAIGETVDRLAGSSSVEIWSSADTFGAAEHLAAGLQGLGIPASASQSSDQWPVRARGLDDQTTLVVMGTEITPRMVSAAAKSPLDSPRLVLIGTRVTRSILEQGHTVLLLSPGNSSLHQSLRLAISLVEQAREALGMLSVDSVSPRRRWPDTREIILNTSVGPIPATALLQHDSESANLAFFYTGHEAHRHSSLPPGGRVDTISPRLVAALLTLGLNVVLIDAPFHGDRKRVWESAADLGRKAADQGKLLRLSMAETGPLLDAVHDAGLTKKPDSPVLVVGQSWGGYHAMAKYLADPRIRACAAIMPIVDPSQLPAYANSKPHEALIEADEWKHRDGRLLLISGKADPIAKDADVRRLADSIGDTTRVSAASLPHMTHSFCTEQVQILSDWVGKNMSLLTQQA